MQEAARTPLRVCTFKGLQNLAMYVAGRQGFFAARALDVEIVYTTGSKPQFVGLAQCEYQLVQTAPDNVVNFDDNPAAFGIDPAGAPRVVMLFGGSVGPLSLYAQPAVKTFDDLRGTVLGVDNPTSGFALLLRDMMARHDLLLLRDYSFAVAGGTSRRLHELAKGAVTATILYAPFDALAAAKGLRRLAASTDYYPAYASLSTAASQRWVEEHAGFVTRYIHSLLQALRWIYDPRHAAAVQELMVREPALELDASMAAQAYTAFVDPLTGFGLEGKLDESGLQQVIDLRAAYSSPSRPLARPADYQDTHYYQQAQIRARR